MVSMNNLLFQYNFLLDLHKIHIFKLSYVLDKINKKYNYFYYEIFLNVFKILISSYRFKIGIVRR